MWFFWFLPEFCIFTGKFFQNFYCWDSCKNDVKVRVEVGMAERCECSRFIYCKILSLFSKCISQQNKRQKKKKIFLSTPTILEPAGDFISGFSDIPQLHACKQYNIFRRGKITKTGMCCYSKWHDFISKMWSSTILWVSAFSSTLKPPSWAITIANQTLENLWKFSYLFLKETWGGPQENWF